jgi:hypothetical protein
MNRRRRNHFSYANRLIALARSRLSSKLAGRIDPEDVVQSVYRSFFAEARAGRYHLDRGGDLWRLLVAMRHCWGDHPGHDEYAARFPRLGVKLRQALRQTEIELAEERGAGSAGTFSPHQECVRPVMSVTALIDALRQCQLLGQAQLDELSRAGRTASPNRVPWPKSCSGATG